MTALLFAAGVWAWPTASGLSGLSGLPGTRPRRWRLPISAGLGQSMGYTCAAALPGLLGYLSSGSPAVALAGVVLGATVGRLVRSAMRTRRRAQERTALLAAVRALSREVRAGADLDTAVAAVRPAHGTSVTTVLDRLHLGGGDPMGPSPPAAGVELALTAAVETSRRFGAPLSVLLAGVAEGLADEQLSAERRSSAVAGARLSGWVLAGLPLVGVLLGAGMGADPLPVLWGGGVGSLLLMAGTVLLCAGLLWSAWIARSS